MDRVLEILDTIASTVIALLRLCFLTVCFVSSGVQIILFNRTEICNVEMRGCPLRCDKNRMDEKLAYVDKLMIENPDLLDLPEREDQPLLTEEELRAIEDFENQQNEEDDNDQSI